MHFFPRQILALDLVITHLLGIQRQRHKELRANVGVKFVSTISITLKISGMVGHVYAKLAVLREIRICAMQ